MASRILHPTFYRLLKIPAKGIYFLDYVNKFLPDECIRNYVRHNKNINLLLTILYPGAIYVRVFFNMTTGKYTFSVIAKDFLIMGLPRIQLFHSIKNQKVIWLCGFENKIGDYWKMNQRIPKYRNFGEKNKNKKL